MKRMYLSNDKKIFGVCGAIGEYFDVDPTIVRIAWIIATVLTGIVPGILAYGIIAAIMPHEPETHMEDEPTQTIAHKTASQH